MNFMFFAPSEGLGGGAETLLFPCIFMFFDPVTFSNVQGFSKVTEIMI